MYIIHFISNIYSCYLIIIIMDIIHFISDIYSYHFTIIITDIIHFISNKYSYYFTMMIMDIIHFIANKYRLPKPIKHCYKVIGSIWTMTHFLSPVCFDWSTMSYGCWLFFISYLVVPSMMEVKTVQSVLR